MPLFILYHREKLDGEKEFQIVGDLSEFHAKEEEDKKEGEANGADNKAGRGLFFIYLCLFIAIIQESQIKETI